MVVPEKGLELQHEEEQLGCKVQAPSDTNVIIVHDPSVRG